MSSARKHTRFYAISVASILTSAVYRRNGTVMAELESVKKQREESIPSNMAADSLVVI